MKYPFSVAVIADGDYTTVLTHSWDQAEEYARYWEGSRVVSIDTVIGCPGRNYQTIDGEDIDIADVA